MTEDPNVISNFRRYNDGVEGVEFVDSAEVSDVIVVFEQFSFKRWGYKDVLRECSLVRSFVDRVFTVNYDDYGRGYLPGCYTSLSVRNFDPVTHRACAYPKTYNEFASEAGYAPSAGTGPALLFSFCGTISSHPVRRAIVRDLSGHAAGKIEYVEQVFHQHTKAQKIRYVEQILNSVFALCPRGWSPATYRLFEVMALGRCPVIISDEWVPIGGIDWQECSVRVAESDVRRIPDLLSGRIADAERLGANARKVWERFFSIEGRNRFYLSSIVDLYEKSRENGRTSFSDCYRQWNSWGFYWSNGWTIPQRARSRLDRVIEKMSGR